MQLNFAVAQIPCCWQDWPGLDYLLLSNDSKNKLLIVLIQQACVPRNVPHNSVKEHPFALSTPQSVHITSEDM